MSEVSEELSTEELSALATGIDLLIRNEGAAALRNGRMAVYASALQKLQSLADKVRPPKSETAT